MKQSTVVDKHTVVSIGVLHSRTSSLSLKIRVTYEIIDFNESLVAHCRHKWTLGNGIFSGHDICSGNGSFSGDGIFICHVIFSDHVIFCGYGSF